MSQNRFAYVEFIEDRVRKVVNLDDVKHAKKLKKREVNKYVLDEERIFRVKYEDGYFYEATVICVGETEEAIKKLLQTKRPRFPTLKALENIDINPNDSEDMSNAENAEVIKEKNIKKKKTQNLSNAAAISENYNLIFKKATEATAKTEDDSTNAELIEELVKENKKLQTEINEMKSKLKSCEEKCNKVEELNIRLQLEILDRWTDTQSQGQSSENNYNTNISKPNLESMPVGERLNGEVHLGRNVWISDKKFDYIDFKGLKSNSKFVRELSTLVFGSEVLAASSVTGVKSNRTKANPRPSLDPKKLMAIKGELRRGKLICYKYFLDITKFRMEENKITKEEIDAFVNKIPAIIAQKILDLNRTNRKTNAPNAKELENSSQEDDLNNEDIRNEVCILQEEVALANNLLELN